MRETRAGSRDLPHPKPVEKIELSENRFGLRLALALVLLLVGAGCITYAVSSLFSADDGWCQITSNAAEYHCGEDFTFLYCLGETGVSATAEKKAITALYSDATELAFRLFTNDVEYEGVHNVYDINRHPNEVLEVDPLLYEAFALVQAYGDRCIYLAPVYEQYDDLFYCTDDSQAVDFDPRLNPEVGEAYREIAAYANDRNAVDIELLGDNRIRLQVSEEYLAYARENAIDSFVDFFWLKNAFIADYLAEVMISNGYTRGCLSSCDGFVRNLDSSGETYSFDITDRVGQVLYPAARMTYSGPLSLAVLRDYGVDQEYYYTFSDGEIRTPYLDPQDGLCKSAVSELICYSQGQSCAEILLRMIPVYLSDAFQPEQLTALAEEKIYSVYCRDSKVLYNDPTLTLTDLYSGEDTRYSAELTS
ncbi:MAG: hypothetical protein ACI3U8_06215 [Candidatus Onthomonas sp.]